MARTEASQICHIHPHWTATDRVTATATTEPVRARQMHWPIAWIGEWSCCLPPNTDANVGRLASGHLTSGWTGLGMAVTYPGNHSVDLRYSKICTVPQRARSMWWNFQCVARRSVSKFRGIDGNRAILPPPSPPFSLFDLFLFFVGNPLTATASVSTLSKCAQGYRHLPARLFSVHPNPVVACFPRPLSLILHLQQLLARNHTCAN